MREAIEGLFYTATLCLLLATLWNVLANAGLNELARSEITDNKLLRGLVRDYERSRLVQIACGAIVAGAALSALVVHFIL